MPLLIILNFILFILGFVFLWYGSGLIIKSVDKVSRKLKVSSFAFSFFVLGILTSIPEISLGLTSLAEGTPDIFVGNLVGGTIVIFFLVIPMYAIWANGVKLTKKLKPTTLLYAFFVFLSPLISLIDQKVSSGEAIFLIILYGILFFLVQKEEGVLSPKNNIMDIKKYSVKDMLFVLLGIAIVFISSSVIVNETIYFAELLAVSPFIISLVILSVGTNLPEISLAIRAIFNKKKDIAFGDYLGSASANVVILSVLTLLNGGEVLSGTGFIITLILATFGFGIFYYFSKSKHDISRNEGLALLAVYGVFLLLEGSQFLR